ncbi:F-box only protein 22 [Trichoplax sp. H2]|nr:F-box only protein 22 [Trichoplax sp. H2]|eukprot:RDD46127.1 F-box only protein 22 [Trichoplax sp. H2]
MDIGSTYSQHFALQLPEILSMILSKLDAKSLCNASAVCKEWNQLATKILMERRCCATYIVESPDAIGDLHHFFHQLPIVPAAINVFSTFDKLRDTRALISCIKSNVPSNCQILGCSGNGIVGSHEMDQKSVSLELEEAGKASILIIPRITGVTVKAFTLYKSDLKPEEEDTAKVWKASIGMTDIKAILLLTDFDMLENDDFTALQAAFKDEEKSAIVGCLCQPKARLHCNFQFMRDCRKEPALVAMAIGGEYMEASTVLLYENDKSDLANSIANVERPSSISYSPDIVYMFPCVGRGYMYYGEQNVESGLIRKAFPCIHVIGCFGYGEIFNLKCKDGYSYYHSYSTALCFCWLKHDNYHSNSSY